MYLCSGLAIIAIYIFSAWMLLPQLTALLTIFAACAKSWGDDGSYYGAIMGLLLGVGFGLPGMVLPLIGVVWVHRKIGIDCPQCRASLTLWRLPPSRVLSTGTCCYCAVNVIDDPVLP